jgi:hypothetical protein
VDGCVRSSRKYTVEAMATNFASGIMSALDMPVRQNDGCRTGSAK